ncbi:RNA-directed DNA polymerase, eukaryota, reverse transcriptase zinc-binding domain protein [Tanacetum coccineum]
MTSWHALKALKNDKVIAMDKGSKERIPSTQLKRRVILFSIHNDEMEIFLVSSSNSNAVDNAKKYEVMSVKETMIAKMAKDDKDNDKGSKFYNISDEVNFSSGFNTYKKAGGESMDSDHCRESEGSRKGGSILMLMDELVKVGQTMGYNMDGCMKNIEEIIESQGVDGVNFLTLQETKMESIDLFEIKRCWGNFAFDYVHSASVGKSGGILCVWDPNAFKKLNSTASDYFVMIQGNWVSNGKLLLIISVYAPQELSEKKSLWDYLCHVIDNWKGSVIIMGDFNEVRNKNERFGTIFNVHGANAFNSFISMANLEEVPLGGCSFTWCHRSASKMSKLDRFLMSESLLSECPNLSAITLDRFLSDHRPILLRESTHDYGTYSVLVFSLLAGNGGPKSVQPMLNMEFPHHLNSMQQLDLEAEVSNEEIKKAVWDCGVDKSPGPDGFTFYYIKSLIPKTPEAKMVKDFRPISLIGSLYKIIAKILANRLVVVLGDIVNEVQSALLRIGKFLTDHLYLMRFCSGVRKLGEIMPRIKSWDEDCGKMVDRLQKEDETIIDRVVVNLLMTAFALDLKKTVDVASKCHREQDLVLFVVFLEAEWNKESVDGFDDLLEGVVTWCHAWIGGIGR